MRKDRDLLDYAQLGISAAQAYKINQMASELGRLREAADNQERKARRLGQMRQMVLMTEELLDRLDADANGTETSLQRQYAMAYEMEATLKLAGVVPPLELESWEDKERVLRLEKRIEGFGKKVLQAMPEDQRGDAELCVRYMAEEPDLGRLIMLQSEDEDLIGMLLPGDPASLRSEEERLTTKFGTEPVERLRSMYGERRSFVRQIIGPRYLAHQDAGEEEDEEDRAGGMDEIGRPGAASNIGEKTDHPVEEEEEQPKVSTAVALPVPAAMAVMVVLSAIGCGLVYGGLNVSGLIGQSSGKDEGDYFVGFLLMLFGGAAFVTGIWIVLKSMAPAVRQRRALLKSASTGEG